MAEDVIQVIIWHEGRAALHKSVSLNAPVGEVAERLARELGLPETDFWEKRRLRYTLQFRHSNEPLALNQSLARVERLRRGSQLQVVGYADRTDANGTDAPETARQPATGALVLEGGSGERFPFEKTVNIIGRGGGRLPADINLEAVDSHESGYRVSRNHAELRYNGGHWSLRLLDARNDTFVDDVKVEHGVAVPINNGSVISIAQESPIRLLVELG